LPFLPLHIACYQSVAFTVVGFYQPFSCLFFIAIAKLSSQALSSFNKLVVCDGSLSLEPTLNSQMGYIPFQTLVFTIFCLLQLLLGLLALQAALITSPRSAVFAATLISCLPQLKSSATAFFLPRPFSLQDSLV
jgi:hypothetical protein